MTAIVLNQQIETMEKKGFNLTKVLFYSLPFVAAAAAYSFGFEAYAMPVFIALLFLCIAVGLGLSGKNTDNYGEKAFLRNVEGKMAFDIEEARILLKTHKASIYRIDSRSHTIQFYIGQQKYTMHIKPKS
jgi:hypothetical protein